MFEYSLPREKRHRTVTRQNKVLKSGSVIGEGDEEGSGHRNRLTAGGE